MCIVTEFPQDPYQIGTVIPSLQKGKLSSSSNLPKVTSWRLEQLGP